jgi:hypothetical protein
MAIGAARHAEWVGETTLRAGGWSDGEIDANAALEARAALKARKPNCTSGG